MQKLRSLWDKKGALLFDEKPLHPTKKVIKYIRMDKQKIILPERDLRINFFRDSLKHTRNIGNFNADNPKSTEIPCFTADRIISSV